MILTANPTFLDLVQDELQQAAPGAQIERELDSGTWRVTLPQGFFSLAEHWRQHPPIFVRHICPVMAEATVHESVAPLQNALDDLLDLFDPDLPFSVQTRALAQASLKPYDVNKPLSQSVQQRVGAPLDVRRPQQILSVVLAGPHAYLGLSPAVYNLSDWAGGARRFAREPGQISRAEFKLLEALEVFQIELPPYGVALDLGAAPGGWTRVLQQRQQYVTAVDPADLHASLVGQRTIRHMRMSAEIYLQQDPDNFDLIVNDMRQDARDSARLMVAYAPYLYRHGTALMTFKLPEQARANVIDHAFNILQTAYSIAGARQLFHNRSEITVHLKPVNRG